MSNGSSPPFITLSKPLDPVIVRVLRAIDVVARALNGNYFVAGATARDIVLTNVFGLKPGRATMAIDFGVAVANWEEFQAFKQELTASQSFVPALKVDQRLIYKDQDTGSELPVDLIPFGGVTSASATVAWPPRGDVVLNVAGFSEAWASSHQVEVETGLIVRVASIPGLTILKLIAWSDRGGGNNKDASDLYRLFTTYAEAGNLDRLYEQEADMLEAAGFDLECAGAGLLGRDAARLCDPSTLGELRALLRSEPLLDRLLSQMIQTSVHSGSPDAGRILNGFCQGFLG
jgi:predicted nucleotidyltransferase